MADVSRQNVEALALLMNDWEPYRDAYYLTEEDTREIGAVLLELIDKVDALEKERAFQERGPTND